MENFVLVRPEHLSHQGYLFGGQMLKWVDESAWLCASRDYPECIIVTIGLDKVEFKQRVVNGAILRFDVQFISQGRTSVTYLVEVFHDVNPSEAVNVFSTHVTFVRVDESGQKIPLPDKMNA
jgi:acyl-CoA hydrolase